MTDNDTTRFISLLSKLIETIEESIGLMKINLTADEYIVSENVIKGFLEVAILSCVHRLSHNEKKVLQLIEQLEEEIVITKFMDLGICIKEVNKIVDSFERTGLFEKSIQKTFKKSVGTPPNTIINKGKYFDLLMRQVNNTPK